MTGFRTNLLTGLAEALASAGVGSWVPGGPVDDPDGVAITLNRLPSTPDRVVCLTDYSAGSPDPALSDETVGVQVRIRGTADPGVASDLGDAVFSALQGLRGQLGTAPNQVPVTVVYLASDTQLGPDDNDRYERSYNYYVLCNRIDPDRE